MISGDCILDLFLVPVDGYGRHCIAEDQERNDEIARAYRAAISENILSMWCPTAGQIARPQ